MDAVSERDTSSSLSTPKRVSAPSCPSLAQCETRSELHFMRKAKESRTAFLARLGTLKDGCLFAGRYKIEPQRIRGKPHCREAVHKSIGQNVFLKFFPRGSAELENAVRMHHAMTAIHKHVCRMLEVVATTSGFPPCLVFERGRYTLADKMDAFETSFIEQRAILYSVLEALESIHSRGIVHGNLTPAHIMWFHNASSWKLVDVEYASREGEITVQHSAGKYAAPEHILAERCGKKAFSLDASSDLWSFGIIAFEILTRSSVINATSIHKYIDRVLAQASATEDSLLQRWLSVNPRGRMTGITEDVSLRFVQSLLCDIPDDRQRATDAMEHALFRSVTDVYQRMDAHDMEAADPIAKREQEWRATLDQHLRLSIDIEYLPAKRSPELPFHRQTGKPTAILADSNVEDHPIYCVKLGKAYRFRIRVTPDVGYGIYVHHIDAVAVKPPDSDAVTLSIEQRRLGDTFVALALFQPADLGSQRLQTMSIHTGTIEERYVRLEVHVKIAMDSGRVREVDVHRNVYCKMIRSKARRRTRRWLGMMRNNGALCRPSELN